MADDISTEAQLVRAGTLPELEILDTKIESTCGNEDFHVRMELRIEEGLAETCALGLIFVLGVLSFHDGRPRGASGNWFEDGDAFTTADMLQHLRFERDQLRLYVDYLRGRCIKTRIDVSSDGRVLLETINRGQAATRWVDRLQGKRFLKLAEGP